MKNNGIIFVRYAVLGIVVSAIATAIWMDGPRWIQEGGSALEAISLGLALAMTAGAAVTLRQLRNRARHQRWLAALDAYAEREIRRAQHWTTRKRVKTLSTALTVNGRDGNPLQAKVRTTRYRRPARVAGACSAV